MNRSLTCTLPKNPCSYDIQIASGALYQQAPFLAPLASRFVIITDDNVSALYGKPLVESLLAKGLDAFLIAFPAGEQHKNRTTKASLEDQLFERKCGKDTCVIALGGGVVTDMAGYIAATYCRGVPLVMCPTTLMGMVDASIGGKTGIDVPYGKNLLGCIYQPKKVVIDTSTLQTLPSKEFVNGIAEMIKHGLIADKAYFEYLETHWKELLALDPATLEQAIYESCRIKRDIVEEDATEQGKRRLLNFGHTVGHALEALSQYTLPHGEAVAIGLLAESHLCALLGALDLASVDRIQALLARFGLPQHLPASYSTEDILDAMTLDKKSRKGQPRFVILDRIGSCMSFDTQYCTFINEDLYRKSDSKLR